LWPSWTLLVEDLQKTLGIIVRLVMRKVWLAAFWELVDELGYASTGLLNIHKSDTVQSVEVWRFSWSSEESCKSDLSNS
jgi:hypothetical protein